MAYNKAKEEYKWKVWKEQEEKKLRELGVSEEVIAELRDYDWNCFKQERNYKNHQIPDTSNIVYYSFKNVWLWYRGNREIAWNESEYSFCTNETLEKKIKKIFFLASYFVVEVG